METIAVIGAGLIGRGWAIVFARAGRQVALYDADAAATDRSLRLIEETLGDLEAHGLIAETSNTVRERIKPVARLAEALVGADYVYENVPETPEAKRAVFLEMDALAAADTVLASSSSGIPASAFTKDLSGRRRCLIVHPVNPPYLIPLVELVPAPWTEDDTVARSRALMEAVGQVPIVVKKEIQGFVINRLQGALLNEAFRLVEDGYTTPEDVDKAVAHGLGLRWSFMGPFETIDLNAPGGLKDYARRYGPLYYEIAKARCDPKPWSDELIEKIEAARRAVLPEARLPRRQTWRDRRLMALSAHKAACAKDING